MSESLEGGQTIDTTKPLVEALHGRRQTRPPFWLMRQAGRYLPEYRSLRARSESFLDFCYRPDLATEATLQPVRRFAPDAAILFSDILVVPHALGQRVSFEEGEGPRLDAVRDGERASQLSDEGLVERLAPVYEVVQRVAAELSPEVALIGFAGAPWTVATYMVEGGTSRDFAQVKRFAYRDPTGFERLIDLLTEATVAHLQAQIAAGADVVQLFDSWAGVLSEPDFGRLVIEPTRRIVDRLKRSARPVPIIGFPRGAGVKYLAYLAGTGVDGIGLDQTVPVGWAQQHLQSMATVQGNLDPEVLVVGGERLDAEVRRIVGALGGGPFIFNLGHGVNKDTPPEHVARLAAQLGASPG